MEKKPAHHTQEGFTNLFTPPVSKGPFGYLKMKYFGDETFADHEANVDRVPISSTPFNAQENSDDLVITWVGHSTFLIQYQGKHILTDPIFSERASPVSFAGPKRLVPMPVGFDDLPQIDAIIISHNHYDHLDLKTIERFGNQTQYYVPLKLKEWFLEQGINAQHVTELDWWESAKLDTITFTATPCQHWSARSPFDRNKTLWASWHIQINDKSIWFAGDTGYNDIQFKEIGEKFKSIDLALIPIGAYAPRWFMKQQHVNPEEAVLIHQDIRAKMSIGMHWGTFQLSAEAIDAPVHELNTALEKHHISKKYFQTMAIGETIRYAKNTKNLTRKSK